MSGSSWNLSIRCMPTIRSSVRVVSEPEPPSLTILWFRRPLQRDESKSFESVQRASNQLTSERPTLRLKMIVKHSQQLDRLREDEDFALRVTSPVAE